MMNGLTRGGVFVEIIDLPAATSGSKSYPRTSGSSLYFYTAVPGRHTVAVGTDANGAGCINWTNTGDTNVGNTRIFVFAKKLVTSDTYGIVVVNDNGEVLADHGYPNPQYVAKISPNATATATYSTLDGYTAYVHDTAPFSQQDSSDRFVLVAMPDSGTNDTWYCLQNECILANSGAISLRMVVYSATASYVLPTLHIYAVNHPVPGSDIYGIQVKDATQALTYDSSVESVSTADILSVDYPAYGSTNTYALAVTNLPGVSIPYFYRSGNVMSGATNTNSRYTGAAKKVGSQLTFKTIMEVQTTSPDPYIFPYNLGSQTGRYCPVVDLSQLAPATATGTPGGATWTAPSFTTQPTPFPRCKPGDTLTLTVAVAGNPTPTLQWYVIPSGGSASAIAGATSATYSRVTTAADDQAQFYCVATNILIATSSNVAKATVNNNTVPVITGKSGDQTVATGTSVTINFTASGTPAPTYSITGPGNLSSNTNSLTFTPGSAGGYGFTCTATNSEGYASTQITITVADKPAFSTQPSSQAVTSGGTASFTVATVGGTANVAFQWYRGGAAISGATSPTYSFTTSMSDSGAAFYCIATNAVGSTQSNTATLTVTQAPTAPSFVSGPTATDCDQGSTTSLSCTANGYPAPSITWSIGGTTIATGANATATMSTTGTRTITCTLSNASGTASQTVSIYVMSTFSVSISPSSASGASGNTATFTATAPGANDYLDFVWTGPGGYSHVAPLQAANGSSAITITIGAGTVGTYTCTVTYDAHTGHGAASTQSHSASCTLSMTASPVISQQPNSVTVTQGQAASFSVAASPATAYQWYRNSVAISGATSSTHSADTSTVGSFSYFCIVYNGAAATQSSTATLTVNAPAQATYPSYNSISGSDQEYSANAYFDIYRDGHYDGGSGIYGYWANGSGDGTLYDVYAGSSATPANGSFAFNTWYSLGSFSGVGWSIAPSGATGHITNTNLSVLVRLRSTGAVVTSGTVTLSTQNGGTPP